MSLEADWKTYVGPLDVVEVFNMNVGAQPRIVFLPQRHNSSGSDVSTFLTELDRSIAKAILNRFARSGDTVYVEQPSSTKIDPDRCADLAGVKLPGGVVVRGWDEPAAIRQLRHLDSLRNALEDICPRKILVEGRSRCMLPKGSISYRAALLFLRMQDFSCLGEDARLTREMLPDPEMRNVSKYMERVNLFMEAVEVRFSYVINHTFVRRGASLEAAISRRDAHGTIWVLGGNKHFVSYENPLERYPGESDQAQSIANLYATLRAGDKPAVILSPLPLRKAMQLVDQEPDAKRVTCEIHQMLQGFSQRRVVCV